MATLTMEQTAKLLSEVGWPKDQIVVAIAVAKAESGLRTEIVNHNTNGSRDVGLFQINTVHGRPDAQMKDPRLNATFALKLWSEQGWSPWVAHNKGRHEKYIEAAFGAAFRAGVISGPVAGEVPGIIGGIGSDPIGSAGEIIGGIPGVIGDIFSLDDLWRNVLTVSMSVVFSTAALALIALGLFRLTGTDPKKLYGAAGTGSTVAGALRAVA